VCSGEELLGAPNLVNVYFFGRPLIVRTHSEPFSFLRNLLNRWTSGPRSFGSSRRYFRIHLLSKVAIPSSRKKAVNKLLQRWNHSSSCRERVSAFSCRSCCFASATATSLRILSLVSPSSSLGSSWGSTPNVTSMISIF